MTSGSCGLENAVKGAEVVVGGARGEREVALGEGTMLVVWEKNVIGAGSVCVGLVEE